MKPRKKKPLTPEEIETLCKTIDILEGRYGEEVKRSFKTDLAVITKAMALRVQGSEVRISATPFSRPLLLMITGSR